MGLGVRRPCEVGLLAFGLSYGAHAFTCSGDRPLDTSGLPLHPASE
jgi:hypothetical protein